MDLCYSLSFVSVPLNFFFFFLTLFSVVYFLIHNSTNTCAKTNCSVYSCPLSPKILSLGKISGIHYKSDYSICYYVLSNTAVTSQVCCFKQLALHGKLWKMLFLEQIGSLTSIDIGCRQCFSMNWITNSRNCCIKFRCRLCFEILSKFFNEDVDPYTVPSASALSSFSIA